MKVLKVKHTKKKVWQNCWYFEKGRCYNCDSPSDIRDKSPDDVCDGGGAGSDGYGFKIGLEGAKHGVIFSNADDAFIYEMTNSEFPLGDFWNDLMRFMLRHPSVRDRFDIDLMRQDIMKIAEAYKYYYDKSEEKKGCGKCDQES